MFFPVPLPREDERVLRPLDDSTSSLADANPHSVDIDLRSRENSSVAWCGYSDAQWSFAAEHASAGSVGVGLPPMPSFSTRTLRAASVGSPTRSYFPSMYRTTAWLHRAHTLAKSGRSDVCPTTSPWGA